jgi:hypothetical protein
MSVATSNDRLLTQDEDNIIKVKLDALSQIWILHHEFFPGILDTYWKPKSHFSIFKVSQCILPHNVTVNTL